MHSIEKMNFKTLIKNPLVNLMDSFILNFYQLFTLFRLANHA